MPEFTSNQLRAIAGFVLLVLAVFYMTTKSENQNLEFVMLALTGGLVGIQLINKTPTL